MGNSTNLHILDRYNIMKDQKLNKKSITDFCKSAGIRKRNRYDTIRMHDPKIMDMIETFETINHNQTQKEWNLIHSNKPDSEIRELQ